MPMHVIEGTWEEIEQHKTELAGRRLRVTIEPRAAASRKSQSQAKMPAPAECAKTLVGFGAFKDALPSSEQYMREKRADIEREERNF